MTSSEPAAGPNRTRAWRTALVAGGVAIAAMAFVVGGLTQRTDDTSSDIPGEVLAVFPQDGTVAFRQDQIGADLQPLLTGTLVIEGPDYRLEVPEDQIELRETGTSWRISFSPGEGQALEELSPGAHRATVLWWSSVQGRPDTDDDGQVDSLGSYTWDFNVG